MTRRLLLPLLMLCVLPFAPPSVAAARKKRLLVVTTTLGFRHDSIPTAERILGQLAARSGAFTVEYVQQPDGPPDSPPWTAALRSSLAKLSPQSLAHYDGVIFASTTGELPLPDKPGFLAWIRSGKAFIGIHSAADTLHGWPEYREMLGGEFDKHGAQVGVECRISDPRHPATQGLGPTWKIDQEEIYRFKNYDPSRVHELLTLDRDPNDGTPGHFPLAWCRSYGKGRVFYTALGHREDVWDGEGLQKDRKNTPDVARAFQAHLLGGILWALGLKPGSAARILPSAGAGSP